MVWLPVSPLAREPVGLFDVAYILGYGGQPAW